MHIALGFGWGWEIIKLFHIRSYISAHMTSVLSSGPEGVRRDNGENGGPSDKRIWTFTSSLRLAELASKDTLFSVILVMYSKDERLATLSF